LSAKRALKRLYHAVRNLPDRFRHARRHATAARRLSHIERPRRILVVCHGNVCRSPYLEAVLKQGLPDVHVASAGFVGPDRCVPDVSLRVSAERGLDLTPFRSQLIAPDNLRSADLIVVMDERQAQQLVIHFGALRQRIVFAGDLDPAPFETRTIHDPWDESIDVFRSTFDRLDRCAATLITLLLR
jgi:protein-tyrosine phosphatase